MFKTRLISGILLLIAAVLIVAKGGILLLGVLYIISLIGMCELFRVFKIKRNWLGVAGYLMATVYYVLLFVQKHENIMILSIVYLILLMAIYVFTFPHNMHKCHIPMHSEKSTRLQIYHLLMHVFDIYMTT